MGRGNLADGANYFIRGLKLLSHPRLRLFIIIPLLINVLVFIGLTAVMVQQFGSIVAAMTDWLPDWLAFLAWIITVVATLFAVLIYGYFFSLITNLIAAPFYGILAEQVEALVTERRVNGEPLWQMIPRTLLRELAKLWYFLWRSLIILILSFVPLFGQGIGFVWGSWSMSVQYTDYAADNHQWSFSRCRQRLRGEIWTSLGFGSMVILGLMIPVVNILVPTTAVIGGTLLWLEEESSR
jgi:CysZ protein